MQPPPAPAGAAAGLAASSPPLAVAAAAAMPLHSACHTDTDAPTSRSIFHSDATHAQRPHALSHECAHAPVPLRPSDGHDQTTTTAAAVAGHSALDVQAAASPISAATPALHSPSSRSSAASLSLSHCSQSRSSVSVSTYGGGGGMGGAFGWRSRAASMADCCDDPPLPDEGGRAASHSTPGASATAAHDQHSAKKPRLKQHHSSPAMAMDSGSMQLASAAASTAAEMAAVPKCAARAALQLSISLSSTPPPLPHSSSSSANSTANHSPALGPAPSPPSFGAPQHYVYVPSVPAAAAPSSSTAAAAAASFTSQTPDGRSSTANSFSRHSWGQPPQTPTLPFSAQVPHSSAHYRFPMAPSQQQSHHHHSASVQLPFTSGPGGALARAHSSLVEAVASTASHHGRAHLHSPSPGTGAGPACSGSTSMAMAGLNDPPPVLPVPGHSCPLLDADADDAEDDEEEELHADQYRPLLPTVKGTTSITPDTLMELLRGCGHANTAAASSSSASATPFSPTAAASASPSPSPSPATPQQPPQQAGLYSHLYDRVVVVDARFPFEYQGGHIKSALNLYTPKMVYDYFLSDEMIGRASASGAGGGGGGGGDKDKGEEQGPRPSDGGGSGIGPASSSSSSSSFRQKSMSEAQRTCIVFHCEYSQLRGPHLFQRLRGRDRASHLFHDPADYASLHYPEMYVLHGGYKAFFERFGAATATPAGSVPATPCRGPTPVPVVPAPAPAPVVCAPSPQLPSFQASFAASARSVSVPLPPSALGLGFGAGHGPAGVGTHHHRPHAISAASARAQAQSFQQNQQQQQQQFQSIASVTSHAGTGPSNPAHVNARWGSGSGALSPSTADAATVAHGVAAMALDDGGCGGSGGGAIGAGLTIDVGQANGTAGATGEGVAAAMASGAASASVSSSCSGGRASALASPSFPGQAPEFEHLFDSPMPTYVRMRDARFKEQCAVLLRDHESEKKMTLARSASTGALVPGMQHGQGQGHHRHSRAAGTRTPALGPMAHPPTPPTPRLEATGARALVSPVPGAGAAGSSPAPLAPRTLTPRFGATALHSASASLCGPGSGFGSAGDHVDMLHTELRTSRRRSASTYTNTYSHRAGTPLSFSQQQQQQQHGEGDPSTPSSLTRNLFSHALPPSGRESFGSTSGSGCGSGSAGDCHTPLVSPVASSRSPVLSRCFSAMMESASSSSPGLGATSSGGSHHRLGQTPSPSRNIFSVGSGAGLGCGGAGVNNTTAPALGSPTSSSRTSVASAYFGSGHFSSSSLNSSTGSMASPSSGPLCHSHSYSAASGGGGGSGQHPFMHRSSSACAMPSPLFGGAAAPPMTVPTAAVLGASPSPGPAAPTPPALPPSPPQLVQSRSDFSLIDSKRPAGVSLNEKRMAAAAAAEAAAAAAEAAATAMADSSDDGAPIPMSSVEFEGGMAALGREREHEHARKRGMPLLPRSLCTSPTHVDMAVAEEEETDNE